MKLRTLLLSLFAFTSLQLFAGSGEVEIRKKGGGQGRVWSIPDGIDCDDTCGHSDLGWLDDEIELFAKPDANSEFVGWSGDCKGKTCRKRGEFLVLKVTATFIPKKSKVLKKNLSGIEVRKGPFPLADGATPMETDKCLWKNVPDAMLTKLKLSKAEAAKWILCVVSDFDDNGFLDFALQGGRVSSESAERHYLILMYNDKNVLVERTFKESDYLFSYPVTKKKGVYGEPATSLPGIVRWGEGGETSIWLWDKQKKDFVKSNHPSEPAGF